MKIFPYIYEPDRSIEVYNQTNTYLETYPDLKGKIENLGWVYHEVGLIIPQTVENFWSGHYFPYSESWDELQVSFSLCCFGLYKQAFISLRSALELGMLSVYFNINDEGHKTVRDWYFSKDCFDSNTPRTDKIWKILLSNINIKKFNDKYDLRGKYNELMFLHNFVHTKGNKFSNSLGGLKGNSQVFLEKALKAWLRTYEKIVVILTTLHLLKYPIALVHFDYSKKFGIDIPNFGGLEKDKIDRIASLLPSDYINEIEIIASYDPPTRTTLSEISSLPDMTEEQLDEQVLISHKFSIEHGEGFIEWEKNQHKLYNELFKIELGQRAKEHIEILRLWAKENGFMESKSKRKE